MRMHTAHKHMHITKTVQLPCSNLRCFNRLHVDRNGGAWCPKQQIAENVIEYLQIDLGNITVISGIATQGRYGNGRGQEYTEQFRLEYFRPELSVWRPYRRWDGKEVLYVQQYIGLFIRNGAAYEPCSPL